MVTKGLAEAQKRTGVAEATPVGRREEGNQKAAVTEIQRRRGSWLLANSGA